MYTLHPLCIFFVRLRSNVYIVIHNLHVCACVRVCDCVCRSIFFFGVLVYVYADVCVQCGCILTYHNAPIIETDMHIFTFIRTCILNTYTCAYTYKHIHIYLPQHNLGITRALLRLKQLTFPAHFRQFPKDLIFVLITHLRYIECQKCICTKLCTYVFAQNVK